MVGLAGVREWRGWRGSGREAFIGRSKLLLLLCENVQHRAITEELWLKSLVESEDQSLLWL